LRRSAGLAIEHHRYWPTRPSIATMRSFHLDNRNIDRRNDANTAEFTRTGHRSGEAD
jgi:hypothetical protein